MRYGLPPSPAPTRAIDSAQSRSTFGLSSFSETSDDDDLLASTSDSETDSGMSSDEDHDDVPVAWRREATEVSISRHSHLNAKRMRISRDVLQSTSPKKVHAAEHRELEEALASIRLRSQHNDPYEEWERNVRKESFKTARRNHADSQNKLHEIQLAVQARDRETRKAHYLAQQREVDQHLQQMRAVFDKQKAAMTEQMRVRDQQLWKKIDEAIALDTKKIEAKLAAERQLREEGERKRREEETKRRLEEEKRRSEDERRRAAEEAKKKEEEERKQQEEEEAKKAREEAEKVEAEKKARQEKLAAEKGAREELGMSIAQDDWWQARKSMASLKKQIMGLVKNKAGNTAALRTTWGNLRRQIAPKIGQLTDDIKHIDHITRQILEIMKPPGGHDDTIYYGLLSSLAKSIIEQAETEVALSSNHTSAYPIAQVAFNFLEQLDGFHEIFWARLVTRTGGWAVPILLGDADWDGRKWQNVAERKKAMGYRKQEAIDGSMVWETEEQYNARMSGIMRVYFTILSIRPPKNPLPGAMWQTPMFWRWIARLLGSDGGGRMMLEKSVGADILAAGLSVMGTDAKAIWGSQFIKVLGLVYEGVTSGFGDESGGKIGGPTPEGSSARVRVQLEIERIMTS